MALIQYSEFIQVGISQFDDEYQHLLDIVNNLHTAVTAGRGLAVLKATLQDLSDFAHMHFSNEENILAQYNYPDLEQHRKAHQELLDSLENFKERAIHGTTSIQFEVMQFLMDWLLEHARVVDKQYSLFLLNAGVR